MITIHRFFFFAAALAAFLAGCGGGVNILPEPFTRERADGKIPVKTELIRQQVRAELGGMPEGEAEVARWQQIETDYNNCRLSSGKAKAAAEQVFASCMSKLGYVYMYRIDAEQLHNDIEFEMEKEDDKRLAAEKKRQEEQKRIRRQKALNDALVAAVRSGDTAEEARLIAEGANPRVAKNAREVIAAQKRRQEELERARQQKELNDALVAAVRNGDSAEEARLIAEGANPQIAQNVREVIAAQKRRQEELERARRQKELDDSLISAVYLEAGGNAAEVKRLIDGGANINATTKDGITSLHAAALNGHTEIMHVLVKAGADINAKVKDGWTPLYIAVEQGHTETALAFVKAGANINAKTNEGWTPLHMAIWHSRAEIALALVKAGADINAKKEDDRTPLHMATRKGQTEIASALIKAGANIEAKEKDGGTPLHFAVGNGHAEIAQALIDVRADINAKQKDGLAALHYAVWYGFTKIALILVKGGANLFVRDNVGKTPLDYAVEKHGKDSAIALFLQGAMKRQGDKGRQQADELLRELE